jgi:hypothetical protein
MTNPIIMVQIANYQWTLEALHRACALARDKGAGIVLMKMLPVQHVGWLGTEFGNMNLSDRDRAEIRDYEATVQDYGLPYAAEVFQFITLPEAIVEAADYVEAYIVFASLPKSIIPYWRQFQLRQLRNGLTKRGRQLIDLEQASPVKHGDTAYARPIAARLLANRKTTHF